jgi:hypothetical protein
MAGLIDEPARPGEPEVFSRPDAMVLLNPGVVYAPVEGRDLRPVERLALYRERWGAETFVEISAWRHVDAGQRSASQSIRSAQWRR